jgi:hypothetical protein
MQQVEMPCYRMPLTMSIIIIGITATIITIMVTDTKI